MINILIFAGLSDKKIISKIEPISKLNYVKDIIVIRKTNFDFEKVKCIVPRHKLFKNVYIFEIYRILVSISLLITSKIDVIIGIQMTYHGIVSFILAKVFKVRYIFNLIESFSFTYSSNTYKRVIGNSNIVITRGERVIKEINNFFHRVINCVYVPNLYLFDNKKVENIENKKKIILYCGSFSKSKRVDILIEALYYLKNNLQFTNYTVKLFGDGELKQEIIKKSFEYGLANLEFNSYINEIEKEIINSDVAIMTSENEGQPMFLVESLAYGIPVIMPNISNIPDLAIHNYNALLVEPLDVEGFADAIYRLMTDEVLYKKLKAGAQNFRKEHEYEFSMENITNIWNDIFKQLGLIEETNAK